MQTAPANRFIGWSKRHSQGYWRGVVGAATEAECWDKLTAYVAIERYDCLFCVTDGGIDPDGRRGVEVERYEAGEFVGPVDARRTSTTARTR
jgi:hypothetical protein